MRFQVDVKTKEEYEKLKEFCGTYGDIHEIISVENKNYDSFEMTVVIKTERSAELRDKIIESIPHRLDTFKQYKNKARCDEMEFLISVDPNWLHNITNQDEDKVCWEELFYPMESGYTTTFCLDCVWEKIMDDELDYDEKAMDDFMDELARITGKHRDMVKDIRLILDCQ